jgi:phosphohistidine swiveling domain-containing protein
VPRRARPVLVGEAVVVAVRSDSATIRVDEVTGAIFEGDLAALHR